MYLSILYFLLSHLASVGDNDIVSSSPHNQPVIVLELFTSQGCESCPAADELLAKLQKDSVIGKHIIPLAYHVDYWDNLGWKDPFSDHEFTERQIDYERNFDLSNFYTPQLVINGRAECVGSYEKRVRQAIDWELNGLPKARVIAKILTRSARRMTIDVSAALVEDISDSTTNVMLAVFENRLRTAVSKGENHGRTFVDDFVTRRLSRVAVLAGRRNARFADTLTIDFDDTWVGNNIGIAVFVQSPSRLEILGATQIPP